MTVASLGSPTLPDPRASQWSRRGLIGGAVVMTAILVSTAWLGYASARDTSRLVTRGQADAVLGPVRRELRAIGAPPTAAALDAIRADLADHGVRYLAVVEVGRRRELGWVVASGTPAGPPPAPPVGPRGDPAVDITEVGRGLRVMAPLPTGRHRGGPTAIVLELEASAARDVTATAQRSLITSCAGAALLLAAALVLARWLATRDREAQARGRERHLASLGEMSAVLAHELRNPLASLKGNAQLLAESLDGAPRGRADVVVEEAVRLERLAGGLLDFVRTGALRRRAADPAALLRAAAAEVAPGRFELDTGAAPAEWSVDPDRMHQVLVNVLRNAVEASPDGAPVYARVWHERGELRLEVRDRGPGIPRGEEQAIFEPFRTGKVRGTGLGLAVARRVVELHGGTIRAARGAGDTGAVIDVRVPG